MTQREALSILQTGVNVFLTGEPGSGKTHTVNAYIEWLRDHGIEPAVTASTGIAATHLHGTTIHSWSGIGIKEYLTDADVDAIASKEHVARRIQKTPVLIIDEISMLSGQTLSMVDAVCREVRRSPDRAFGGMQVVLVGDFFQLPPISKGKQATFAFNSPSWDDLHPVLCYLTEQHRQDDKKFLSVLASIRAGDWDASTVSTIVSRQTDIEDLSEDVPRLYTHNVDVDALNAAKLTALAGAAKSFRMEGTGAPTVIEGLKRGCLSPELLSLKEGAVVMGTKNIPALGLVNGTRGIVLRFERGTGYPVIETLDGREITVAPADWEVEENGKVRARISQIPLRLAWAITVHKSQGMSMDEAAVDLGRAFEYGQGYVALSRVRRLSGLHVLGWSEQALVVHPEVASKDAAFRDESDEAIKTFDVLEATGERAELMAKFIKAAGGTLESNGGVKAPKKNTYDETFDLLAEGKSLEEAAAARGLTYPTICTHAEKLLAAGRIDKVLIEERLPESLHQGLEKIHAQLKKYKNALTPVYAHFNETYTYDDLRLARVLMED